MPLMWLCHLEVARLLLKASSALWGYIKKCWINALDVALSSGGCKAVVEGFFRLSTTQIAAMYWA